MDEWDALEKRCGFTVTVGSNPTLSARKRNSVPMQKYGWHKVPYVLNPPKKDPESERVRHTEYGSKKPVRFLI